MTLPCKDCITLGVCKGRMSDYISGLAIDPHKSYRFLVVVLTDHCSLLKDYMKPDEPYDYILENRNEAIEFFTGRRP